jgi:hypothetical protein
MAGKRGAILAFRDRRDGFARTLPTCAVPAPRSGDGEHAHARGVRGVHTDRVAVVA